MTFVESAASPDAEASPAACFLCDRPAAGPALDATSLIVYRARQVFAILNLYPYNSGHLLVAPYRHTGDLPALEATVAADLMAATQRAVQVLQRVYRPDAFNVGMNLGRPAGAGVPDHLHVHVVPRWSGDTNFMPVLGDTKVLPESLEQTYLRVREGFLGTT